MEHRGDEYRTHANYCRHMAEGTASLSFKDEWVRLAASWTKLADETKARSRPS